MSLAHRRPLPATTAADSNVKASLSLKLSFGLIFEMAFRQLGATPAMRLG